MSTIFISGLLGVSIQKSFVAGVIGGAHRREIPRVNVGEAHAVALEHSREEAIGAAVKIVSDDDVVAGREQAQHRAGCGHAAGKRAAISRSFERRELLL